VSFTLVNSDTVAFADGSTGHIYTPPSGAPSAGQLDVLCVDSDTTVSTPVTTGGAAWTLGPTFVGDQGAYIWYRVATGGEGSTITFTTSGNFPTSLGWSRWSGAPITADVNAVAHLDASNASTTPAVTTSALSITGELVIALAALHGINVTGNAPVSPVWSTGYTNLTTNCSGLTAPDVATFVGYKTPAGTAAESPNVSWTNAVHDEYILVQTFEGGSTAAPAPVFGAQMKSFP
jgi:hypothetical protein